MQLDASDVDWASWPRPTKLSFLLILLVLLVLGSIAVNQSCKKPTPELTGYSGRFDVSVHYEDNSLKVYTVLDTTHCKSYIAIPNGGIEFLEINKPCLKQKKKRDMNGTTYYWGYRDSVSTVRPKR